MRLRASRSLVEDGEEGLTAHDLGEPERHGRIRPAIPPLEGDDVESGCGGVGGERLRLHEDGGGEAVGLAADAPSRRSGDAAQGDEGIEDDLVGFVEHGVLLRALPLLLVVLDVVHPPRSTGVKPSHALRQACA